MLLRGIIPYISDLDFLLFVIPSCLSSLPRNELSLDAELFSRSKASVLIHVASLSSSIYSTYTNHFIFLNFVTWWSHLVTSSNISIILTLIKPISLRQISICWLYYLINLNNTIKITTVNHNWMLLKWLFLSHSQSQWTNIDIYFITTVSCGEILPFEHCKWMIAKSPTWNYSTFAEGSGRAV